MIRVGDNPDQIIRVRTRVRHTTIIQLPGRENILDFVVGDSEYWHLTGAANLAFLKPISEGVSTNVALVCESGRIYSFLVSEQQGQPHLVVRIASAAESDPRISPTIHQPAFVARESGCSLSTDGGAGAAKRRVRADRGRAADRRGTAAGRSGDQFLPGRLSHAPEIPLPAGQTKPSNGRSWCKACGTTANLPTYVPTLRSPRRSMRSKTASRRWLPTTSPKMDSTLAQASVGRWLATDRKKEGPVETGKTGDWTMSQWKRIHDKATGSLPVSTITKWGVVAVSLLLAAFLLSQSLFNSAPEEEPVNEAGVELPAGPGTQAQVTARIREEGLRQEAQRQAAERTLQRRRELGMSTPGDSSAIPTTFPSGVVGADPIVPSSEAEAELREVCAWKRSNDADARCGPRLWRRPTGSERHTAVASGGGKSRRAARHTRAARAHILTSRRRQ